METKSFIKLELFLYNMAIPPNFRTVTEAQIDEENSILLSSLISKDWRIDLRDLDQKAFDEATIPCCKYCASSKIILELNFTEILCGQYNYICHLRKTNTTSTLDTPYTICDSYTPKV